MIKFLSGRLIQRIRHKKMVSAIVKKKPATTKKPRYSFPMASPIHMDSPILSSMEEKTTGTTTAHTLAIVETASEDLSTALSLSSSMLVWPYRCAFSISDSTCTVLSSIRYLFIEALSLPCNQKSSKPKVFVVLSHR